MHKHAVIVCGGRKYGNFEQMRKILDPMGIDYLICGGATGADMLAYAWATNRRITAKIVHARWKEYGKSAGPRRNVEMLRMLLALKAEKTTVIAFPGGVGTGHMVNIAKYRSVPVITVVRGEAFASG